MNDSAVVRAGLVEAIRLSGLSREQIADEMSRLTATSVTVRRLNAFTAESREDFRFPLELVRAFCVVVNDFSLLESVASQANLYLVSETAHDLIDLGREYLKEKRANEKRQLIEKRLQGVEL